MSERPHPAEETLNRLLRDVPPRRAPATLEARVLQALQDSNRRRSARQGFGYWPLPSRLACVTVCSALALLTLVGESRLPSATTVVPLAWWYVGLGATISLYAALFGLAALGYHALYLSPPCPASPSSTGYPP